MMRMWKKGNSYTILVGIQIGIVTINQYESSSKNRKYYIIKGSPSAKYIFDGNKISI